VLLFLLFSLGFFLLYLPIPFASERAEAIVHC
jgi:hypothetical protein